MEKQLDLFIAEVEERLWFMGIGDSVQIGHIDMRHRTDNKEVYRVVTGKREPCWYDIGALAHNMARSQEAMGI